MKVKNITLAALALLLAACGNEEIIENNENGNAEKVPMTFTAGTVQTRTSLAEDGPCRRICSNKTNVPADLHELSRADGYVPTRLMYRLICNLPELSIRIFNPLTSYFLIYRCVFRIADPYIFCCRIANPTEH